MKKRQSINNDRISVEASSAYACVNLGKNYARALKDKKIIIQWERDERAVKTAQVSFTQKDIQVKK